MATQNRGREETFRYRRGDDPRYHDRGYNSARPYFAHGRISRINPFGSGYHIWVGGAPYPFYVPYDRYRHDRFRIGLMIQLGGIYNRGGYYDYYDDRYGRYDRRARSSGHLRGTVESVDYRRGTFVVRNDATGSFVTVSMNDRGDRNVREGDYVEVYGEWSRSGTFLGYDVDRID